LSVVNIAPGEPLQEHKETEEPIIIAQEKMNAFLDRIYLRKSVYQINGGYVEQTIEQLLEPVPFIKALQNFESG
jgi:hypothetical protein